MDASPARDQDSRIASLERSLRRMRWVTVVLGMGVVTLGLLWYGVGGIARQQIVAHRITLVDASGHPRVVLKQDAGDTHRKSRAAGLFVFDRTGHERGGMGTTVSGNVILGLDAPYGLVPGPRDRVGMMVDSKGHSLFFTGDNHGQPVVVVRARDAGGSVEVMEPSADGKGTHLQTLGTIPAATGAKAARAAQG